MSSEELERFGITISKDNQYNFSLLNYGNLISHSIDNLSSRQKELLNLFLQNEGKVVPIEEIEKILSKSDDFSIWGIYKSISRFKKAIAPKYLLQNVRKKGYILRKIHS